MMKRIAVLLALGATAGLANAGPVEAEDWAKYPAIAGLDLSWEGDTMVGMVHEPGTDGMKQAVASWDLSGKIDTTKPLVPDYLTPGNDRMRLVGAQALKNGVVFVQGSQAWTGESKGCLEGKTTGNNATFISQTYMTDKKLRFKERDKAFVKKYAKGRGGGSICEMVNSAGASIVSALPLSKDEILLSRSERGVSKYVRYNLDTGNERLLFRTTGEFRPTLLDPRTSELLVDSGSEPISGSNDYEFLYRIRDDATGEMVVEPPLTAQATNRFLVDVVGRDDKTGKYFVITDKFRDKAAVYFYDAKTNQFDKDPVFAHPEYSAVAVRLGNREENFNQVLGFTYGASSYETYWIDPEMKSIQDGLDQSFQGKGDVVIQTWNKDMSRVLFRVGDERFPNTYYILVDKSKVAVIGNSRPWIDPNSMGKTELVHYTARDGLKIPAYLTYPAGWKQGDPAAPLIVSPHGGPWVRDVKSMDFAFVAPWASKGYFVLQPQYRGSQGWGRKLWLAGDNEWGQKMQDDKDDGAAWLVSKGWVDSNKMAIMGYSYGGYAAMAAAVRPNSPYQCAIAGAGVANLAKLGNNWSSNRLQKAFQGRTVTGLDPMQEVENANIPILIIHGDRDVRVPMWHGRDYYNAIKNHTDAKLYIQKDSPHGFPWPQHRREWVEQINDYLSTTCNMPPPVKG
jgi:dienelactone hydrolase